MATNVVVVQHAAINGGCCKKGPGYALSLEAMTGSRESLIYVTCVYTYCPRINERFFGPVLANLPRALVALFHPSSILDLMIGDRSEKASMSIISIPLSPFLVVAKDKSSLWLEGPSKGLGRMTLGTSR
ncbi:unnamed protein product [Fraxinus pennsylvanica]|uniref:Uncharacterized protein n=1 Tax=Fraxinus pennsylvanica TaxID=56036 RepID=A0AAD1Z7V7_9LAMI|nr:unnamed protein product [Fraxinus pennsylvanica]